MFNCAPAYCTTLLFPCFVYPLIALKYQSTFTFKWNWPNCPLYLMLSVPQRLLGPWILPQQNQSYTSFLSVLNIYLDITGLSQLIAVCTVKFSVVSVSVRQDCMWEQTGNTLSSYCDLFYHFPLLTTFLFRPCDTRLSWNFIRNKNI